MVIRLLYKYISSKPKKQIFIIVGISEQQFKAISKYWEKHDGPNSFDRKPFRMFNIPDDEDSIIELFQKYYGKDKWYELIKSHEDKIYKIKTPHYDIDYLIKYIVFNDDDTIDRVEARIDPNGKVRIDHGKYGDLTLTIKEIYDCKDSFEFLDKYYPQVEKDSDEYDEMSYELDKDFFEGDNGFVDSLEDHILSELSGIITKPYGVDVDYVVLEDGKKEDFDRQLKMFEQFDRIKTLINFSCK